MKILVRLVILALALALGTWLWFILFPSPEKVIRSRVQKVAQSASFAPGEGPVATFSRVSELTGYFAPDVRLHLNSDVGSERLSLSGRDEIHQGVLAARARLSSLEIEFQDVNVTLGADRETAIVGLTARAAARGEDNFFVGELQFSFKKIEDEWLITRVESVKVLR